MRYVMSLFGAAAVLLATAAISLGGSTPASAAVVTMQGTATGAEENPPVAGSGTVQVRFTFDDATKVLTYSATVNGISPAEVTASHIHRGAKGVNGPIIYPLSTTSFSSVSGQITLTDADVADLKAGNLYFNAHSNANPGGFARFQLILPAAPTAPAASPTAVTASPRPPATGDGGLIGDGGSSNLPLYAGAAALVMLSGLGALTFARRRA
jgi:hypothetical protein